MPVTPLSTGSASVIIAASAVAGTAPGAGDDGFRVNRSPINTAPVGRVRTLIDYTGVGHRR